ncbi:MAG: sigma 54-interacting transcriptional regulator, partial [Gammaproteobacteria bacterium]|nr:sigma 54-interacting transcriptional regulator [Gammaproteobacteria bacterium]MBU2288863.1 sigma 54-interacting transcriptional regulator [Gammaproteobacteria bacterium]
VDSRHCVIAANPPMEQLLGRSRQSMLGVDLDALEPALSLADTLQSGLAQRGGVLQLARRDWIVHRTPIHERGVRHGAVITLYDSRSIADADTTLRTQRRSRESPTARYSFRDLSGVSPAFLRTREAALRFACTDLTVLITGESGTGKELFAQAIHRAGPRADKPFIAMNCSAFPEALLESELFGYDDGAFTGARKGGRCGMFEAAHTGTLFLDEIGDMPVSLQTRLLRVLQEREVVRLGGHAPIPIDVRVIAATHQHLPDLIAERRFRADLYYRLNILRLQPPPLRERRADIPGLARELLARALRRLGSALDAEATLAVIGDRLLDYAWPGNVRELENLCERIAVFAAQYRRLDDLAVDDLAHDCPELFDPAQRLPMLGTGRPAASAVEPWTARLQAALDASGGNRQEAARRLGMSRATLWRKMKACGLLDPRADNDTDRAFH